MIMTAFSHAIHLGLAFFALSLPWHSLVGAQQIVQDTDPGGPTFDSTWVLDNNGDNYGGVAHRTDVNGGTATFKFTGTAIGMYGVTHNDGASFTFTVDGTHTQDCTCYADSTVWVFRGLVCSISGLDGSTSHNLVVKHNDNNGLWLNLDFFYITTSTSISTTSKTTSTTPPSTPTSTNPDSTTKTSTLSTSTTSTSTSTSASASMNSAEGSLSLASVSSESLASTSTAGASNSSPAHASTHSSHTGAIAGGVVGGIGGLMIVSAAVFLFLRQRGRRRGEDPALYGPTSGLYAPSTYPATDGTQSLYPLSAAVTGTPSHPSQASNSPRYGGYSGYSEPHSAIPEMSEVDAHYGNPYNAGQAAAFPVYTRVDHLAES